MIKKKQLSKDRLESEPYWQSINLIEYVYADWNFIGWILYNKSNLVTPHFLTCLHVVMVTIFFLLYMFFK